MFPEQSITQQEPGMPESFDRIHLHFDQLREEINAVIKADADSRNSIQRLERELSVYQRAYSDLDAERKRVEILKLEADKKIENLDNQLKGHRVIALIDGDGVIFNSGLISEGRSGGHLAAQKLSDSIIQHLNATNGTNQYQLWVYVFLNKRGLTDTFGRARLPVAKHRFEEFIVGFNQAAERFMMIDVGSEKEAADAKIKALLEDEIRLPQTEKIIFGGCHDNGYVTTLRSQITAGFKNKITLLRGYTDMAMGISDLDLPSFSVPELFIPQKLIVPTGSYQNMPHLISSTKDTSPHFSEPKVDDIPVTIASPPSIIQEGFEELPFASVDTELPAPKTPPSYSSAVQTAQQKRAITPELDSSDSTSSSDGSDDGLPNVRPSLTNVKSRRLNPNIVSFPSHS
ncbi:hypothetical protein HYPSUDRAFT_256958 [Hypholoma sublateritium FD-334 SS-4]|uniref:DUF7923 domain-containing protein n=1 Tax=Hypholoma sublateritium (strain FD-334 SS-4) TaxID=945553 RepID=A0A0D2N108_HYPSF|nr:hypothetical protein HYPSUDRAFT_256958 [Hypholoma sublateritium FD-334 SS-4]